MGGDPNGKAARSQVAATIAALASLIWALLACAAFYHLIGPARLAIPRITRLEAAGVKVDLAREALRSALLARDAFRYLSPAQREGLIRRAEAERVYLDGAEILWVDDNLANNRAEARFLALFGAIITVAASTEEALRAIEKGRLRDRGFNLVISDIRRDEWSHGRGGDGIALLRRLQKEVPWPPPVVFYIGAASGEKPDGAVGYTDRPDKLVASILDTLGRTRESVS